MKGLKFVPQPPRVELRQDLKEFGRRLRLKEFFFHDPNEDDEEQNMEDARRFKEKSTWTPPKNGVPALEAYIQVVEKDALRMATPVRRKDNFTPEERDGIANLRSRNDIVIKPADKGSATVVLSKDAYLAEAYRQLSDTRYYAKLDKDPTREFTDNVSDLVREIMETSHIKRQESTSLYWFLGQSGSITSQKPISGRPIMSSCGAPTECISEFVDYHLHPLVIRTESYLKDTTDFLLKLSALSPLPPNSILVTLDVNSLYMNIPHDEGIKACRLCLGTRPFLHPPTVYLTKMMKLILKQNNFTFNNEHSANQWYSNGTRMAPLCTNLFMASLEVWLLSWTTDKPLIWWHYIHDIFTIWDKGQKHLEIFFTGD